MYSARMLPTGLSLRRPAERLLASILATVVVASLLAGCSSEDSSIVVYSGRNEELIQPLIDSFAEDTGVEVEVRYGDSAELALLIGEEGENSPADVFLSQSPGAMGFLEDQDMLLELRQTPSLDIAAYELVPDTVRDADGHWLGLSGRLRVLVYNPNLVTEDELPSSVFDLADPEWRGRVAVAPANGSFQDFVTAMRASAGEEQTAQWLSALAANDSVPYPKNSAIVDAVNRGEVDVGLVNHYYNFRAQAEDPSHVALNHQFAATDPGNVLIVTAGAIVGTTDNAERAEEFLAHLLSADSQRYFADETFEYPLASGVAPATEIPPAEFSAVGGIDVENLAGGLEATRELIIDAGLEG